MGVNVIGNPPFPLDSHKKPQIFKLVPKSNTEGASRYNPKRLAKDRSDTRNSFAPPYLNHHRVEREAKALPVLRPSPCESRKR
jgi:hypothetical protein